MITPLFSFLAGGRRQGPPVLLCLEDIPSCPVLVLFQPCLSSCLEGGGGWAPTELPLPAEGAGGGNRDRGGAGPHLLGS